MLEKSLNCYSSILSIILVILKYCLCISEFIWVHQERTIQDPRRRWQRLDAHVLQPWQGGMALEARWVLIDGQESCDLWDQNTLGTARPTNTETVVPCHLECLLFVHILKWDTSVMEMEIRNHIIVREINKAMFQNNFLMISKNISYNFFPE